jgi:hypothetical protein
VIDLVAMGIFPIAAAAAAAAAANHHISANPSNSGTLVRTAAPASSSQSAYGVQQLWWCILRSFTQQRRAHGNIVVELAIALLAGGLMGVSTPPTHTHTHTQP